MFFKILSVAHGWFVVDLNREFVLVHSDYLGCDAPALFLEAICDLLEGKAEARWLCWQDEPGALIVRLERFQDELHVEVYGADREAMDLEQCGDALSGHITDCLYRTCAGIGAAAEQIFDEFELYENGNGLRRYRRHWGAFPQREFDRLKKSVGAGRCQR